MGKNRMISTKFWDDSFIINCDPIEKLLFLYILTNPLTSICGIYEISLKRIAFDTGIDKEMIIKILERFEKVEKIKYENGWIALKNFINNQKCSDNPEDNINKGIEKALLQVPENLKNWIYINNKLIKFNINIKQESKGLEGAYKDIIKEVIDYLNSKTNKHFTYKNEAYNKHIKARLNEGFTIDDFKKVIDTKIKDKYFIANPQYLNPETLFRPGNFEKYLNEKSKNKEVDEHNKLLYESEKRLLEIKKAREEKEQEILKNKKNEI